MTASVLALFNNKGGVGKTSLVYHLAYMYAELGVRVVAADLDPQANLTAALVPEERLEELWPESGGGDTIYGCLQPLIEGSGDAAFRHLEPISDYLALLVGDLRLSGFEDPLSEVWPKCLDRNVRAFRITTAFWRIMQDAAREHEAQLVLVDAGPNLGAINRAVLLSADHVVVPLAPDLFSLRGLMNLGPTLRGWRSGWRSRAESAPDLEFPLPSGAMTPLGYVVLQHSQRLDRPARAYEKWIARIPRTYGEAVLGQLPETDMTVDDDPHSLALLRHYRSLVPMALEARKPIFSLKYADGAIGAHVQAVARAYDDFRQLALKIAERAGVTIPPA